MHVRVNVQVTVQFTNVMKMQQHEFKGLYKVYALHAVFNSENTKTGIDRNIQGLFTAYDMNH